MTYSSFDQMPLIQPLQRALRELGYTAPTPVQAAAIPPVLEGRDLLGCSQTGTGKTAAFALPLLQRLAAAKRRPARGRTRALVLTPTRELAVQVADSFKQYGRHVQLSLAVVYGGVGQRPQVRACSQGLDVLVATPGRLLDLINQGHLRLDRVEFLVLDEADRMLDMGFLPDIKRVLAMIPRQRQTLFFSATMPPAIARLADSILTDPERVQTATQATPVERIDQSVLFVSQAGKRALLGKVLSDERTQRVLVFTRTKHGADRVAKQLINSQVKAEAIHGNKSQNARQRAMANFRTGRIRVLVATDVAARGIDVDGITHVINYDIPHDPESYVHRIGRTARAGCDGVAISFCNSDERSDLRKIERLIKQAVPVQGPAPAQGQGPGRGSRPAAPAPRGKSPRGQRRRRRAARAAA